MKTKLELDCVKNSNSNLEKTQKSDRQLLDDNKFCTTKRQAIIRQIRSASVKTNLCDFTYILPFHLFFLVLVTVRGT
jgi:hypothetical protein